MDVDMVSGKAMCLDTSAYIAGMGSIPWAAQVTDLQLSGTVSRALPLHAHRALHSCEARRYFFLRCVGGAGPFPPPPSPPPSLSVCHLNLLLLFPSYALFPSYCLLQS